MLIAFTILATIIN